MIILICNFLSENIKERLIGHKTARGQIHSLHPRKRCHSYIYHPLKRYEITTLLEFRLFEFEFWI